MANAPVLDLTKLSSSELAALQRALEQQRTAVVETAPDYTGIMPLLVCHNPDNPHVFTQTEVDNKAIKGAQGSSTLDITHCPTCGARLGYAPVAVNGIVVEQQHAAALRAGDTKVLAIYHNADNIEAARDGEPTDAKPSKTRGTPFVPSDDPSKLAPGEAWDATAGATKEADKRDVNMADVQGTGKGGTVTAADVVKHDETTTGGKQ